MTTSTIPQFDKTMTPPTLGIHRGAIDQTTITTEAPPQVMKRVKRVLDDMGIEVQEESEYKYRCIRPRRRERVIIPSDPNTGGGQVPSAVLRDATTVDAQVDSQEEVKEDVPPEYGTQLLPESFKSAVLYGQPPEDPADEVRFSVELTRLSGLADTYSLDMRRLKGNLRSYKFLYDILRQQANLQR